MGCTQGTAAGFAQLYNASTFERALRLRGAVVEAGSSQWEVMTESGEWQPYDYVALAQICAAEQHGLSKLNLKLGSGGWTYELNLHTHVQRNPKTGKEPI